MSCVLRRSPQNLHTFCTASAWDRRRPYLSTCSDRACRAVWCLVVVGGFAVYVTDRRTERAGMEVAMASEEAAMAREPSRLEVRGISGLQSEIGRGKIAEAAYNHMRSIYGPAGTSASTSICLSRFSMMWQPESEASGIASYPSNCEAIQR